MARSVWFSYRRAVSGRSAAARSDGPSKPLSVAIDSSSARANGNRSSAHSARLIAWARARESSPAALAAVTMSAANRSSGSSTSPR